MKKRGIAADLVYIDPPFASGADYAKKIYLRNGGGDAVDGDSSIGEEVLYGDIWQKEDYLNWMYERLLAIREVMSESGSIYVHLDWHIGHYVKVLMDEVFGEESFQREIIWENSALSGFKTKAGNWVRAHDTILFYSKSQGAPFNKQSQPHRKEYLDRFDKTEKTTGRKYFDGRGEKLYLDDVIRKGKAVGDVWYDIMSFQQLPTAIENTGYATQKPEALLRRIIEASSNPDMVVADFFCGSGTAAKVANDLGRRFIACDVGENAMQTARDRLQKAGAAFDVLHLQDGVRLFRNPAKTREQIFALAANFQSRAELGFGAFWDGGITGKDGKVTPMKFIGFEKRLTKNVLDAVLQEIIQIQDGADTEAAIIVYVHKEADIDDAYFRRAAAKNKRLDPDIRVRLLTVDEWLGEKAGGIFPADSALLSREKITKGGWRVKIEKFYSPYLADAIAEWNARRAPNKLGDAAKPLKISAAGLELIEAVQFDLRPAAADQPWQSAPDLEDRAAKKEKIKGAYTVAADDFRVKIRSIAGDEIIIAAAEIPRRKGAQKTPR
jgi:adenine-specific DNA-methyltransferase